MCGIAGFVGGDWSNSGSAAATLARMNACLRHRGPDRADSWTDPGARVALAFNRLAILDLSPAGDQPMHSASGRFVIVLNGEIYNHAELRDALAESGRVPAWRGHSDTESLLAAIEAWGLRGALERSAGMFAFALWDRHERTLSLARDRLGEKPLYYGRQRPGGPFLFGSEIKALAQHPAFEAEVDRDALTLLLRYGAIPAPFSIHKGIAKLAPGTVLTLREGAEPAIESYWSGAEIARGGIADPLRLTPHDAVDALEALLERSVARQMVADVPLGAFLSGGVDSSTIVALMQKLSARPVKTFSIGFREQGYDEAQHAAAVARHLGTDHTELYVTPAEAREVIPRLPDIYDEPFADSSQIPTHLVAALARRSVTVALSGDGGDELFGGYERYRMTAQLWRGMAAVPRPLRAAAGRALTSIPPGTWNRIGDAARPIMPRALRVDRLGDKIHKGVPLLGSISVAELYTGTLSAWSDPASAVIGGSEPVSQSPDLDGLGPVERMMALDLLGYLPADILAKLDRAAMAVSLETRVPFLDHHIVEFAWRLPLALKLRGGTTKWVLRELLYRHVPRALVERPKMGFGVPIGAWLRGPLRDWAEALLDPRRLEQEGFFHAEPMRRLWQAHVGGKVDAQNRLWPVLMFQSWHEARQRGMDTDRRAVIAG
jgi:asparagine synthase (glutamine-hydrolysing)